MSPINIYQILAILAFRLRQMFRIVRSGGLSMLMLSPFLLLLIGYGIKALTDKGLLYINGFAIAMILLADLFRKDKAFLLLLRQNGIALRFVEYASIALLLNLYAFSKSAQTVFYLLGDWVVIACFIWASEYIIDRKIKLNAGKWVTNLIPVRAYELKYAFRQLILLMAPLWLLSFIASFYAPVLPISVLLVCLFLVEHISYREPIEITQSYGTAGEAINGKVALLSKAMLMIFLPHIAVTFLLWFSAIVLFATLLALWIGLSVMVYALLLKYSYNSSQISSVTISIKLLVFLVVSPLVPLSVYLLYKQYKTAQCKLKPLLK